MDERERLTFLTKNYNHLQSLRFAAFDVTFIVAPWIDPHRMSDRVRLTVACVGLVLCAAWYWIVNRYYKQRYGQIKQNYGEDRRYAYGFERLMAPNTWPGLVTGLIVLYFLLRNQSVPVDPLLLYFTFIILGMGLSASGILVRRLYLTVAGLICLSSLLPDLISTPGHLFFHLYHFTFFGVAMLMVSIFDHMILTHNFRQLRSEINA